MCTWPRATSAEPGPGGLPHCAEPEELGERPGRQDARAYQLRHGARMTRSAGWCPGPGTPDPAGLKGPASGIPGPLAFPPSLPGEKGKDHCPSSEMGTAAWHEPTETELLTPHFLESQGLHSYVLPGPQVPLTTVHPPLLACRRSPPAVRPLRPAPPPGLQSLPCTKEVPHPRIRETRAPQDRKALC